MTQQLGEASAAAILGPLASGLGFGQPIPGDATDGYSAVPRCPTSWPRPVSSSRSSHASPGWPSSGVIVLVFEDLQWADSASGTY